MNTKLEDREQIELRVIRDIDFEELRMKDGRNEKEIRSKIAYFENEFRKISNLLESYLMFSFNQVLGKFDEKELIINILASKSERDKLQKEGYFEGGGGVHIINPPGLSFPEISEEQIEEIRKLNKYVPILVFFGEGRRQHRNKNNEIAFGLFFKILEGIFLKKGTNNREGQFIKMAPEIKKVLPFYQTLYDALNRLLTKNLKITLEHRKDKYEDMLVMLIRLRDQLSHFNQERAIHYFDISMSQDLDIVNSFMISAIYKIIFSILKSKE